MTKIEQSLPFSRERKQTLGRFFLVVPPVSSKFQFISWTLLEKASSRIGFQPSSHSIWSDDVLYIHEDLVFKQHALLLSGLSAFSQIKFFNDHKQVFL